jgi:hypothetical protein
LALSSRSVPARFAQANTVEFDDSVAAKVMPVAVAPNAAAATATKATLAARERLIMFPPA